MEDMRLSSSPARMDVVDLEDRQEDLRAPDAGRFTILSPAEREQGLAQARENISPSGISGFFRSAANTVIGWFSSDQAKLNSARALLAKPTTQLTAAVNFMTRFNAQIEGVRVDGDFAPMTFENFDQYIQALQHGQLLIVDEDSETGFTAVNPARVCEDRQDGFEMRFLMRDIKDDLKELGPQMINVGNDLGKYLALTPDRVLGEVQKTVNAWRDAVQTVGATVSDAEFRGIVTAASQTLGATVNDAEFVEAQAVTDWADRGQQNFVNEAAQQFADAVKTLKEEAPADQADQNMQALETLLASIDTRARSLGGILGDEDTDGIKDRLLDMLNENEGFRAALTTVQGELREVVRTNQDVADLTQETMDTMIAGQTGIIEAEKTLEGTPLKGEAAVAGSFSGLLDPENAKLLLMAGGMSAEAANKKVAEEFPEHADRAVEMLTGAETALANTIYQNDAVIAEGQRKAEVALGKLALLNEFISEDNKDEMEVDPDIENDPIELPMSQENRQAFIGTELREAFLERFEILAGQTDEEAHATLLEQLIVQLGPEGTEAVLGAQIDPRDIFASRTTATGERLTHGGRTLLTFARSEDGPRGIDQLRARIKANRAVLDHKKAQQRELEEALMRSAEPKEASRGILATIGGLFRRSQPAERQEESPEVAERVETRPATPSSPLILPLDEEDLLSESGEERGTLAKIGHAMGTPFRWIAKQFSSSPRPATHSYSLLEEESLRARGRSQSMSSEEDLFIGQSFRPRNSTSNSNRS